MTPDASYVALQREVVDALNGGRYRLVLSLLDVMDARATKDDQKAWLKEVRGSVEAAMRIAGDGEPPGKPA